MLDTNQQNNTFVSRLFGALLVKAPHRREPYVAGKTGTGT